MPLSASPRSAPHKKGPKPAAKWGESAGTRLGAMLLALLCGVAVPLSPLGAEYFVTARVEPVSWFAVAVTYVAGVGLVSKSRTVLVTALLGASVIAFIYGVDMKGAFDAAQASIERQPRPTALSLNPNAAVWMTIAATLVYVVERVGRHLIDGKPFLET